MNKKCDACEYLKNPNIDTQIIQTEHWSAGLGNNQAYFGRTYVTLREHIGSLGTLSAEQWQDFEEVVRKIERAYKEAFGAEPLNWSCCMNHAFRQEPFNPHVHWHIYPRYKKAPIFNSVTYDDALFGNMYDNEAERLVSEDVVAQIAEKLRSYIK